MNFNDMVLQHEQRISKLEQEIVRLKSELVERPKGQSENTPSRDLEWFEGVLTSDVKDVLRKKSPEEPNALNEATAKYSEARGRHELNVAWRGVLDELADVANCAASAGSEAALEAAIAHVVQECGVNESLLRKSLASLTDAKRKAVDPRPRSADDDERLDDDTGEEEIA